jgi:hypothetical protein
MLEGAAVEKVMAPELGEVYGIGNVFVPENVILLKFNVKFGSVAEEEMTENVKVNSLPK